MFGIMIKKQRKIKETGELIQFAGVSLFDLLD